MRAKEYIPYNWIADGMDAWRCYYCEEIFTEEAEVENHPTKNAQICQECLRKWKEENE